jgi:hypothetical protein
MALGRINLRPIIAAVSVVFLGCEPHLVEVRFEPEGYVFSRAEQRAIQEVADAAARDVRTLLPALPERLKMVVRPGTNVIPETGETGTTVLPDSVYWTVDPARGVLFIARTELRAALFHELHHLVRDVRVPRNALVDAVLTEGLATAFERDFGKANPPWGVAPPDVMDWTREVLLQPETTPHEHWLSQHPDGRRWIAHRVGTFLADRATRASGLSAVELVITPTEEIVRLADLQ